MSVGGPPEIHIAPQGYETECIYEPVIESRADRVVLLRHEDQTEQGRLCREEIVDALDGAGIDHEPVDCDFFDLDDVLQTSVDLIRELQDEADIWVNISSGSKITAVGCVLACMLSSGTPYYVEAEGYTGETISTGAGESKVIPTYPLNLPHEQYVEILRFIDEQGDVNKGELVEFCHDRDYTFLSKYDREEERYMYEPVRDEVIRPLEERNYVKIRPRGNEDWIELTGRGEDLLELFGHLVED